VRRARCGERQRVTNVSSWPWHFKLCHVALFLCTFLYFLRSYVLVASQCALYRCIASAPPCLVCFPASSCSCCGVGPGCYRCGGQEHQRPCQRHAHRLVLTAGTSAGLLLIKGCNWRSSARSAVSWPSRAVATSVSRLLDLSSPSKAVVTSVSRLLDLNCCQKRGQYCQMAHAERY